MFKIVKFAFRMIIALNVNLDIMLHIKTVLTHALNVIMRIVLNVKIMLDIVKHVFTDMHYISQNKHVKFQ
jgi:hypothetical protein